MASPQFSKGDISLVAVLSLGTVAGLLYGYWFLVVFLVVYYWCGLPFGGYSNVIIHCKL